jgi:2-keto-3-deoxy-6-phosphogluconate aldolase
MLFMSANVYAGTVVVELTIAECETIADSTVTPELHENFKACAHVAKIRRAPSEITPTVAKSE